jgi:uncharacterized protein YwgA
MSASEKERIVTLGGILYRIGNFDSKSFQSDFNSRLVLQKTIYLMEQFGLNIGYYFSWYLRGPYSPALTRDAYELTKFYSQIQPVRFAGPLMENRFREFLNFVRPIAENPLYLEKIASIHFLLSVYPNLSSEVVYQKVRAKIPNLTIREYQDIKAILKNYNLLKMDR